VELRRPSRPQEVIDWRKGLRQNNVAWLVFAGLIFYRNSGHRSQRTESGRLVVRLCQHSRLPLPVIAMDVEAVPGDVSAVARLKDKAASGCPHTDMAAGLGSLTQGGMERRGGGRVGVEVIAGERSC
jgi:hypothetical protein